ncbi:MAG: VanZ family protein [Verrucomicrobiota bacterium]|nr:VanZ family protein [Verrucomicrobiota bacterium]
MPLIKNNYVRSELIPWLWVALWMLVIFLFSTSTFSGVNTSRIIGPILKWLTPEITNESIALIQFILRKTAHIIEYAVLAVLICNAIVRRLAKFTAIALIVRAVFISLIYAAFDEWHQSWSAGRIGSLIDVSIDTAGALFGSVLFLWMLKYKSSSI